MAAILKVESVTSKIKKSDFVNRRVFSWRKLLPNFIQIRFETENGRPTTTTRTTTTWEAIWESVHDLKSQRAGSTDGRICHDRIGVLNQPPQPYVFRCVCFLCTDRTRTAEDPHTVGKEKAAFRRRLPWDWLWVSSEQVASWVAGKSPALQPAQLRTWLRVRQWTATDAAGHQVYVRYCFSLRPRYVCGRIWS